MNLFRLILPLFELLSLALATFKDAQTHSNSSIAVYWGQASHMFPQNDISYYCQSESVDIIIMAFISVFGNDFQVQESRGDGFELNLSNFCTLSEDGHHMCNEVGKSIQKCQELGKKVMLSLGGEQPEKGKGTYGFGSDEEAREFAGKLWNYFGEGKDIQFRPFGDAVVDGFDIDAENTEQVGYLALVRELSSLSKLEGTKDYYFSSAPQCSFPDKANSVLIDQFELDYLFVQFYNNACKIDAEDYNYYQWSNHLRELGYNKTQIFLGLPSSKSAVGNGFIEDTDLILDRVQEIRDDQQWRSHFGGLMFWDAAKGFDLNARDSVDDSYIYKVWNDLDDSNEPTGATVFDGTPEDAEGDKTLESHVHHHKSQGWSVSPQWFWLMIVTSLYLAL